MNLEVILLAVASAPRPAGLAALYALLSASHPRRVLIAYLVAGFTFSVALGVTVVAIFQGAEIDYGGTDGGLGDRAAGRHDGARIAVAVATGRAQPPSRDESSGERSAMIRRLHNPSAMTAAAAGVATHLPGLFYLVALNAIIAEGRGLAAGVLRVLVFNAIWIGAAIATVVIFLLRPGAARRALGRLNAWARRHARATTVVVSAAAGSYLAIKGALGLVD